jgi:hypothetical protein
MTVQATSKFLSCVRSLATKKKLGAMRAQKSLKLLETFFSTISENENKNLRALATLQARCEGEQAIMKNMKEDGAPILGTASSFLARPELSTKENRALNVLKDFVYPTAHCKVVALNADAYVLVGGQLIGSLRYCNDTDGSRSLDAGVGFGLGVGLAAGVSAELGGLDKSAFDRGFFHYEKTGYGEDLAGMPYAAISFKEKTRDFRRAPAAREIKFGDKGSHLAKIGAQLGVMTAGTERTFVLRVPLPRDKAWYARHVMGELCRKPFETSLPLDNALTEENPVPVEGPERTRSGSAL